MPNKLNKMKTISNLRHDAQSVIDLAKKSKRPIIITQRSKPQVAMMGIQQFESLQQGSKATGIDPQKIKVLLNFLTTDAVSLNIQEFLFSLSKTLATTFPEVTTVYAIHPSNEMTASQLVYIRSAEDIGGHYLSVVTAHLQSQVKKLAKKYTHAKLWVSAQTQWSFQFESGARDETCVETPESFISSSFVVDKQVLGIFQIYWNVDPDDELRKFLKMFINDVANYYQNLDRLVKQEEDQLSDLVESMGVGVLMFDSTDKSIIIANQTFKKFFELEKAPHFLADILFFLKNRQLEIEGQLIADLSQAAIKIVTTGKPIYFPKVIYKTGIFEIQCQPVIDNNHKVVGGAFIFYDITELEKVNRVKSDFITFAAHRLRTPLSGMRWNVEMLQNEDFGKLAPKQDQVLSDVYANMLKLIELVDDLLTVSDLQNGESSKVPNESGNKISFEAIWKRILKSVQKQIKSKKISVVSTIPKNLPKLKLDAGHLESVLSHLLNNAIQYNLDTKGRIKLDVSKNKKNDLRITIENTGLVIPEQDTEQIFDRFYRARQAVLKNTEGTGLGLYLVKSYVNAWGGEVNIVSNTKSTKVTVTVPASQVNSSSKKSSSTKKSRQK